MLRKVKEQHDHHPEARLKDLILMSIQDDEFLNALTEKYEGLVR
jgi:hypothetical protein